MAIQFTLLLVGLALRLTATNGTAIALAGFLIAVCVTAIAVGFLFTGKTWCNFLCPVGFVEKIYTEPARPTGPRTSRCAPCTACKKNCPDIDLEQAYWKERDSSSRRWAYYAWPGVVLGFYVYFYALAGNWSYYFQGAWTREDDQAHRALDSGFYFSDVLPVAIAAPLTLLAFGLVSALLFWCVERTVSRAEEEGERARHQTLVLAGFLGFIAFYVFGGQPTLRQGPAWTGEVLWVLVVAVATSVFWLRFRRTEAQFVQEKFAEKILKKWKWGDAPPSTNLQDIYLVHHERDRERAARLSAYTETVREMVHDGLVTRGELVILDSLRGQLGVSDKEHERILADLKEEDRLLFDPEHQGSMERRLQLEQYQRELLRAALIQARSGEVLSAESLKDIRDHHNISHDQHAESVAGLRRPDGPIGKLVEDELGELDKLASAIAGCKHQPDSSSYEFLRFQCRARARQRIGLTLDLLGALEGLQSIPARAGTLSDDDPPRAPGWTRCSCHL